MKVQALERASAGRETPEDVCAEQSVAEPDARPPELLSGPRAAGELGLRRGEFARAVQLGLVRPGPRAAGGAARFTRAELDRVRAGEGYPGALRERVETVAGADAGARALGTGPSRFTRLARCGHLTPVGYRINRYRAVVWLYLAAELREFAAREPGMLSGAAPPEDREMMEAKADLRPRRGGGRPVGGVLSRTGEDRAGAGAGGPAPRGGGRGGPPAAAGPRGGGGPRHVGLLLRRTADPWERAAVLASVLPEQQVRQAVPDPAERIVLAALAPPPPYGHPQVPAAAAVAGRLLLAEPPDEVHWYRTSLDFALTGARGRRNSTGERGQSNSTGERGPT
ncbi:DUF6397 family protein [Streptomyces lavendulae]|uniref:DUF6397 family protein n=1 Tax=Streptomyces lavendulae TaxID=1914 RepID=UPI003698DF13